VRKAPGPAEKRGALGYNPTRDAPAPDRRPRPDFFRNDEQLARQHANDEFLLFAYVIMPSHVHLLIAPKAADLISVMREFKSCTGMVLAKARCSRHPIWQPRYFDFVLRRMGDFWDKLEYIHENPVEAGLAEKPKSWVWSSAAYYARAVPFPISMDSIDLPVDRRAWLRATP
jgi:REP element-mobilizing transposase RayT